MPENRTTTIAWSTGHITVSDPGVAEAFIEALTQKRLDAVITVVWDDLTEERALIHDVSPEDLALERLAIEGVGDFSTIICEVLTMEQAPAEDMHCPGCNQQRWWIAILEEAEDEHFTRYVRRLRTCRVCGYQMTTREMRSSGISNSNAEQGAMETAMEGTAITDRAKEIFSEGATDNIEEENTVAFSEFDGEATVFRIFRRRHTGGDPMEAADRWIKYIKKSCTTIHGTLKAGGKWSEMDGGSVTVAITGQGIVAREELESGM